MSNWCKLVNFNHIFVQAVFLLSQCFASQIVSALIIVDGFIFQPKLADSKFTMFLNSCSIYISGCLVKKLSKFQFRIVTI